MESLSSAQMNPSDDHKILCCGCGCPITPNPANMCVGCLRTQIDITEDIPKQVIIYFCKFCERYLNPPNQWVFAALESRELMALCLKKLKGLNKVKLIDANFVWTEPHSRRIKIKMSVQGEVVSGTILQQTFVVEYVINNQMCDDCHRVEAKDVWNASVQVRQRTNQKKTLYYLEQLLMKYEATKDCSGIKVAHDGLDFFFASESNARKLVEFLQSVIPIRYQHAKKLISHDINSNTYNYKYTFSVEVVPICKDNVICLPAKLAHSLGGIGQICHVNKVTSILHLVDPNTCQFAEINANVFFKHPFKSLTSPKTMTEYTVMNIESIDDHDRHRFSGQGAISKRHVLADVWVCKSSELGVTDATIHTRSHLGHLLNVGDSVMGFDLKNCNVNDENFDKMKEQKIPDVVLVKKVYANKALRNRKRKFRLKHMDGLHENKSIASENADYVDFLEDLEEDADLRQHVNVYKDPKKIIDVDDTDSEFDEVPRITLAEMMDDLAIVGPDATGEDGADMIE